MDPSCLAELEKILLLMKPSIAPCGGSDQARGGTRRESTRDTLEKIFLVAVGGPCTQRSNSTRCCRVRLPLCLSITRSREAMSPGVYRDVSISGRRKCLVASWAMGDRDNVDVEPRTTLPTNDGKQKSVSVRPLCSSTLTWMSRLAQISSPC